MRQLKFRVWNGYQFVTSTDIYIKACNGSLWDYDDGCLWSADAKIQQYTGLKDRHEKEIYEGDIVKIIYDEAVAEIYFDFNLGAFRLKDNSGKSYPITTYRFDESNKPIGLISVVDEVVGNIMENPELLKA
jgi:uncharacterized phage protein (TIGR01671 family)